MISNLLAKNQTRELKFYTYCSDNDSNLAAKKRGCAITQPSYQLNTFHHAMNVYDSLSLSFSFSPQLKTCNQAEKTHKNKST